MIKICKSCGCEYKGDWCEKCGWGNPDLKVKAFEKYEEYAASRPEKFMTESQKEWVQAHKANSKNKVSVKKQDSKKTALFAVFLGLVILGVLGFALYNEGVFGKDEGYKDVVMQYFKSVENADFDGYVSCFADQMRDEYIAERDSGGYSDEEYMKALYADFEENYGSGYTVDVKFGEGEPLSKSDVDVEAYEQYYGVKLDFKEAYLIIADVAVSGKEKRDEVRYECYLAKIGKEWKLMNIRDITPVGVGK